MSISDEEPFLPLEVKESGFVMHGDYLYCAVILYNPNENYCVEFPTFRITARDADGLLLGTAGIEASVRLQAVNKIKYANKIVCNFLIGVYPLNFSIAKIRI